MHDPEAQRIAKDLGLPYEDVLAFLQYTAGKYALEDVEGTMRKWAERGDVDFALLRRLYSAHPRADFDPVWGLRDPHADPRGEADSLDDLSAAAKVASVVMWLAIFALIGLGLWWWLA